MSDHRQVTVYHLVTPVMLLISLLSVFSCRLAYNYPDKPFIYKTNIKIDEKKMSNDQRLDLRLRLENQLDDSMQARAYTTFEVLAPSQLSFHRPRGWRFIPTMLKKLPDPPVFDTLNLSRSINFMTALLNSLGYIKPVITDTFKIKKRGDQYQATINFLVAPGKRLTFDSVGFDLQDSALQKLALKSKDQSLLKKGEPYSKQILVSEMSRLIDTFKNNGYYNFSREDLYIEHDTVIAALLDPTLDPFQQADLLEKLKTKRENPTINVVVKQRPPKDSSHLTKYYIGNVTVYPDLPALGDTSIVRTDTTTIRNITLITRSNKFRLPFIVNNIYLRPGRLYKQENYFRTTNRFSQLPAWQYNIIDFEESEKADSLLNVTIRMYPAKKQNLDLALEASRNTNDIVTASNLFGVGVNLRLQNRNAFKQSVQTSTSLRGGVELGANFIQTTQASISHTIAIPRRILPKFLLQREGRLKSPQTLLNVNASYIDRRELYTLRSLNGSWGYQWSKTKQLVTEANQSISHTKSFLWKIPNVEYTTLYKRDSFNNILKKNPSLALAFRTGLVIGEQFIYNDIRQKGNKTNSFRVAAEESGALLGLITELDKGDLLRFIKGEVDYTHNIDYGKNQLVFHTYAGAGLAYGRQGNGYEQTLPFYKAFFSGGPNSMRAWQVRRLGLGSSKFYNDTTFSALDRFGDVKLEGNIEYRLLLGTLFTVKIRSALYTDIGNIWNWKPIDTSAEAAGSDFKLNRFYKEFAVGVGTGLRLDFAYFLIRLDWAYKIRDPQRADYPNRWFYDMRLFNGQFQLGINYPF